MFGNAMLEGEITKYASIIVHPEVKAKLDDLHRYVSNAYMLGDAKGPHFGSVLHDLVAIMRDPSSAPMAGLKLQERAMLAGIGSAIHTFLVSR